MWTKEEVIRLEQWDGIPTPVVITHVTTRDCGCSYVMGMRSDKPTPGKKFPYEPVFGAGSCERHPTEVQAAMITMRTLPPQDIEAAVLWEMLLDHEIEEGDDGKRESGTTDLSETRRA